MALVNGKILKGDDCPYKNDCGKFKETACNGEGCPFIYGETHDRDFSCATARFLKLIGDVEKR